MKPVSQDLSNGRAVGFGEVDPKEFRRVMGTFATGVTIVTTRSPEGDPYGVTVNSFTSVSLDPPLVLVCLDDQLSGLEAFLESRLFAVNILSEDQRRLSNHFARKGSDRAQGIDKLGVTGTPILGRALAHLECEVEAVHPGGDHTILVGRVRYAHKNSAPGREPLLFYRGGYRGLK